MIELNDLNELVGKQVPMTIFCEGVLAKIKLKEFSYKGKNLGRLSLRGNETPKGETGSFRKVTITRVGISGTEHTTLEGYHSEDLVREAYEHAVGTYTTKPIPILNVVFDNSGQQCYVNEPLPIYPFPDEWYRKAFTNQDITLSAGFYDEMEPVDYRHLSKATAYKLLHLVISCPDDTNIDDALAMTFDHTITLEVEGQTIRGIQIPLAELGDFKQALEKAGGRIAKEIIYGWITLY